MKLHIKTVDKYLKSNEDIAKMLMSCLDFKEFQPLYA